MGASGRIELLGSAVMSNKLTIAAAAMPFQMHRTLHEVPHGWTLQQMHDAVITRRIKGARTVVTINGETIPQNLWPMIKPKQAALVGIVVVPQGGKKKNPFSMVLNIALMVAAPYAVSAMGFASLGLTANTLTFAGRMVAGAISMVGSLAVGALMGAPKQSRVDSNPAESPTQFIEGAGNAINPYGVVPWVLGRCRMFPPQAAQPYTETSANRQYARQLFTWGFGSVVLEDIRIGETPIERYSGVSIAHRLNADLNLGTSLYTRDVFTEGLSILLSKSTGWVTRTTQVDTNEAILDATFQNGLTKFDNEGKRVRQTVDFEVQYAPTGTSDWTPGAAPKSYSGQSFAIPTFQGGSNSSRIFVAAINPQSGAIQLIGGNYAGRPIIPDGFTPIAAYTVQRTTPINPTLPITYDVIRMVDERPANTPRVFVNGASFIPTYDANGIYISSGSVNGAVLTVSAAQAEAVRASYRIVFPAQGQYDVRIRRLTDDATDDRTIDRAFYTALKSIGYRAPVNQKDISGTAIRILGTDQLNGQVDQFNAIVSSVCLDWDKDRGEWVTRSTSNPASLYRYVLQGKGNNRPLPNARINLVKLQEWHEYCEENSLTYDNVVDSDYSQQDLLNDICAAGFATIYKVGGIYSVIIDNERPNISAMVTPRNSWGYSGTMAYPELPHALRVEFKNSDKDFYTDERIVYRDGFNAATATLFERLQFPSCKYADLAYKYGRRYFATAILQPEQHTFSMDFEAMTFNRGDRITLVNDAILVGIDSFRIKEYIYDDPDNPSQVLGFVSDTIIDVPSVANIGVRVRDGNAGGFPWYDIVTVQGENDTFTFSSPIDFGDEPPVGSLCAMTELGGELDLIVTDIVAQVNNVFQITAIDYAPARFTSDTMPIPPFDSNITVPTALRAPDAPILANAIQSDESVMVRNPDGTFMGRMIIPLLNVNGAGVIPVVRVRVSGTTIWNSANIVTATEEMVVLTGLQDETAYDIEIRYRREGISALSLPLVLGNQFYIGASGNPSDVLEFRVSVVGGVGLFTWRAVEDIDLSHYEIRFTGLRTGATWGNSQVVQTGIIGNSVSLPYQEGTWLIKAFDLGARESANAATIVTLGDAQPKNVVKLFQEQPDFLGAKVNTVLLGNVLQIIDPEQPGYYYFDESLDLGEVYTSDISASIVAYGANMLRIRSLVKVRGTPSIRGSGGTLIRSLPRIRDVVSIRGIDPSDWSVEIQYRITMDDPADDNWSAWQPLTVGAYTFRAIEFRAVMQSFDLQVTPRVSLLEVLVDMPDRTVAGEDILCPSTGITILYPQPFMSNPSLVITAQDGAVDDRLEFVSKNESGFTILFYNATIGVYVTRTFDYNATGYGRKVN